MAVVRLALCAFILGFGAFFMLGNAPDNLNKRARPESGEGEEGEAERKRRKKAYIELMHRADPETNWREVERQNVLNSYARKRTMALSKSTASFGGGYFTADWYERGNDDQAGRITSFAYRKSDNTLYGNSDGGTIWKMSPPSGAWSLVTDDFQFTSNVLDIAPLTASTTRILTAQGEDVMYSDNNGTTFNTSTGITYPVPWGGNRVASIITLDDVNSTVYCLTQLWEQNAWAPRVNLYRSTDKGATFSFVYTFNCDDAAQVSWFEPLNSGQLYAMAVTNVSSDTLFSINGTNVTPLSSTNTFPAGANRVKIAGMQSGPTTHIYAITNQDRLYYTNNNGTTWNFQSNLPNDMWDALGVSSLFPNFVSYGEVDCRQSSNSGLGWTLVNNWYDYYGAEATNLHADIQSINYFQYTNGSEFCIIGTDGGAYISNDHLATVNNISLTGLRINQLWDHISAPSNPAILFGGTQDQGLSYTNAAAGTGILNMTQLISGDYGQMRITKNETTLWTEYPGGDVSLYGPLNNPNYLGNYTMTGTELPNYGWMLPTADHFTSGTQNEILIGGGNVTGGPGSYLIKLTADANYNVSTSQYPYDFRANSTSGTAGISAIAVSKVNNNLMYVACEDGSFFYSTNAGTSWTATSSFTGPESYWLYGSSILPSKITAGKVFFAGSGYSNPPVYMSTNNGQTFTDISNGLPPTLVNRLAMNDSESLMFAATEAGPYVYVFANSQWYPLETPGTPVQNWKTVEFLSSINTARFSTYGRGIWDLRITSITAVPEMAGAAWSPDVMLVPNPAKSGGEMKIVSKVQERVEVTLLSMNGQFVWSGPVTTNTTSMMPVLPTGVYICRIKGAGGIKTQVLNVAE